MTAITVFVDWLTKMVHFVPYRKDVIAQQYAHLFIDHVFKLHGLLEVIISDHDPKFISKFWDELFAHLGMDLRFSTAFHPQTDGQSEVTDRVMENFLWPYVEWTPHTWVQQLPLVEFATNNAISVSTRFSPFYLNAASTQFCLHLWWRVDCPRQQMKLCRSLLNGWRRAWLRHRPIWRLPRSELL